MPNFLLKVSWNIEDTGSQKAETYRVRESTCKIVQTQIIIQYENKIS